ncbi:MAG: DUF4864 domain-containing protein [Parachlamydia sp.]|nr:DUF4864 domain-containing protein [Parachlamydia sp.]
MAWTAFASISENDLAETIQGQLKALKGQQLTEAYYAYTSQTFQQTTSLDKFKEFIRSYPILVQFQELVLNKTTSEGNKGAAILFLTSGGQNEAEVDYQLVKEEGGWKIEKIDLVEYRKNPTEEPANATAAMIAPIKAQLEALKSHDLLGAYKNLVSKQFQLKTPFESFKAFVVANPILTQHGHYDFKGHEIVDGRGIVTIHLDSDGKPSEPTPVEYRLVNEEGLWKILMMRIAQLEPQKEPEKELETSGMIDVVRAELDLFAQGKTRQVYEEMIAKETKATVSFDNFQIFVQTYPVLSNHKAVNIREPSFVKGVGRILAEVADDQGTTTVEYNLTPEEGHWKILGMHITSTPEEESGAPSSYKVRDLIGAIEAFLSALRAQDSVKAYQYTSKEFQYANSQADFDVFFSKHPEFAQSQASRFEKELFNNAIATFSGQLILPENKVMPVEFDLVLEEGKWKILHIYALPVENAPQDKSEAPFSAARHLEFVNLQLGTKVDDDGRILNPATTFKPDAGDIYATLTIRNGIQGSEIRLILRHIDSGSALKPVTTTLNDHGDNTLTFVFSPPPKGWPIGSYQLRASSSSNVFKNFTFTVE